MFSSARTMLALHRFLLRFALVSSSAFILGFLYVYLGYTIAIVSVGFASLYLLAAVFAPLFTKLLEIIGARLSLYLAVVALMGSLASVISVLQSPWFLMPAICWYFVFMLLYRLLYRIPYAIERETVGEAQLMIEVGDIVLALVPIAAGIAAALFGLSAVLSFMIVILFLCALPLYFVPSFNMTFPWSYSETVHVLFGGANRMQLVHDLSRGAHSALLLVVWPMVAFGILRASFDSLGLAVSVSMLTALLMHKALQKIARSWHPESVSNVIALVGSSAWIARIFIGSPIDVYVINAYHSGGTSLRKESGQYHTIEHRSDSDVWLDEMTVVREMGENLGRAGVLAFAALLAFAFGSGVAFVICCIVAAFLALATGFASR
jgi:hypothetical protein